MIRLATAEPLRHPGQMIRLEPEDVRHLEVRRASAPATVELLDGRGAIARGIFTRRDGEASVRVETIETKARPRALWLLVGAGDRDRLLWVVEKAQELGATDLVPLLTERALSVATRVRAEHQPRLVRRAREAMKQSGNPWGLAIHPPADFDTALERVDVPVRWLADRDGAPVPAEPAAVPTAVLVGPEGGLTDRERADAVRHGFVPTSFAPHTLRFETAAVAAVAILASHRREAP